MADNTPDFTVIACYFFFQAEDGIRDVAVTGVQTCALPISVYCRYLCPARRHCSGARAISPDFCFGSMRGICLSRTLSLRQRLVRVDEGTANRTAAHRLFCRRYSVRLLERGKLSSPDTSVAQDAHYFLSAHADPRDARANPQDSLGHYLQRACCLRLLGRPIVSRRLGGPTFVGG